jgi:hypothetical protein
MQEEEYRMGRSSPKEDTLKREPQVSSELNNLDKCIAECSALLAVLEQKLVCVLPGGQAVSGSPPPTQKEGSTLVPLAFSVYSQSREVKKLSQRISTLNNDLEI